MEGSQTCLSVRLVLVLFFFIGICGFSSASGTPLRVRADSWMPFNGVPGDEKPGYVVEILHSIFGVDGIDYQTLAWDEALKQARAGKIDAVIGANPTEAAGLIRPNESVGIPRIALFALKQNTADCKDVPSLSEVRLGVIVGYSYWDELDAYVNSAPKNKVIVLSGDTPLLDGIKKLKAGEIDMMVETVTVFEWNVKSTGGSVNDFRKAFSHLGVAIYVAFANNPTGAKNAERFDLGIKKLRESGRLEVILNKYGVRDWL